MLRPKPAAKTGIAFFVHWKGLTWELWRQYRRERINVLSCKYCKDAKRSSAWVATWARKVTMLKPSTNGKGAPGILASQDPRAFEHLPALRGFFLDQTYGADDTERAPGLMILGASLDSWRFTLKDTSSCVMLRFGTRTLDEGFALAEAFLGDPRAPWETDPYEAGKRGRSRKPKA